VAEPRVEHAVRGDDDPTLLLARIAHKACELIDHADGASVLMLEGDQLRTMATSNIAENPPGRVIPIETDFAQQALAQRSPICLDDIVNDERISPEYRGDGRTRSVIVTPLFNGDQPIGLLAVISRRPAAFDGEDICSLVRVAEFVGVAVAASINTATAAREVREALRTPMILPDSRGRPAARQGDRQRVSEFLDDVIRPGSVAAQRTRQRVRDVLLGDELASFVQPVISLAHHPADRITVELTEHLAIENYSQARMVVDDLRSLGARIAIDDVGAGYSSFRHVVELEPDCIKLDRSFIAGFETKPMWAQVARAVVQVANNTGANLVAEGIETENQLLMARQLGVTLGQGYLIARPCPPAEMPTTFKHLEWLKTRPWAA
jgi:GAF domain-containing protein